MSFVTHSTDISMKVWHSAKMMGNASIWPRLTLWFWWQRQVWARLAHSSFQLCEPCDRGGFHACTSACTPCDTSQPFCRSASWSPFVPTAGKIDTCKELCTRRNYTQPGHSQVSESLPSLRPQSAWFEWPSLRRRPFAFSKGSQGPLVLFFYGRNKYNSTPSSKDRKSSLC